METKKIAKVANYIMNDMPEEEIIKKFQFDTYEEMISFLHRIRSLKKSKPIVKALMEETKYA